MRTTMMTFDRRSLEVLVLSGRFTHYIKLSYLAGELRT